MKQTWRESLAKLLFSNGSDEASGKDDFWPALLQAAPRWAVVPQVAAVIRSRGWETEVAGWQDFKRVFVATRTRSTVRALKGVAALQHLNAAGIPALAFKGLASMALLYAVPEERTIGDTDVLVTPEQVPAALASLADIGYRPAAGQELEKIEQFLDKSPAFAGNKAIALYGLHYGEIDLHWSVGFAGSPPALMLERSETGVLFELQVRVPAAADAMILTARHAVRENFTIDKMCRDLLDIGLWCERLARSGEMSRVLAAIHRSGHATALLAMTQILAVYDGNSAAAVGARSLGGGATEQERRIAGELMRIFFAQLREGPMSKDLLYLAHTKPIRQILAGLRTDWRAYRGVMRSFEELDGKELRLARRTRLLARAVRGVNLRKFRSIRALAHLKYDN